MAAVYLTEGNETYRKGDFTNAIHFYTEGIMKCQDEEQKAKLCSNRAAAHFKLGKSVLCKCAICNFLFCLILSHLPLLDNVFHGGPDVKKNVLVIT